MHQYRHPTLRVTSRGFQLVEFVTVLVIIGTLSAVAVPGIVGGVLRAGIDGATRQIAEDIRLAQSHAFTRGVQVRIVVFDSTGTAPNSGYVTDASRANQYRLEMRSSGSASWPALGDKFGSNQNVLTQWTDLNRSQRVQVTTGDTITFNSQGFPTGGAAINIVLQGTSTKTVQTSAIGRITIL